MKSKTKKNSQRGSPIPKSLPFPENLIRTILGYLPEKLPEDIVPAIEHIMGALTDTERQILTDYYINRISARDISRKYGVSGVEAYKIRENGLQKLESKSNKAFLVLGYAEAMAKASFPRNLIESVLGACPESLPEDIVPAIEFVLESMKEDECAAIKMRYMENRSTAEIAEALGIEKHAAQRLQDSAIRRLKTKSRISYFRNGLAGTLKGKQAETVSRNYGKNYPENLVRVVFGADTDNMPEDINGAMNEISERLDEREKEILTLRYKSGYTLAKIANMFYMSPENVHVIEISAVNRLILEFRDKESPVTAQSKWKKRLKKIEFEAVAFNDAEPESPEDSINNLELSAGTLNALHRVGIHTISTLSKLSSEQLSAIRLIGRKKVEEITGALAKARLSA